MEDDIQHRRAFRERKDRACVVVLLVLSRKEVIECVRRTVEKTVRVDIEIDGVR